MPNVENNEYSQYLKSIKSDLEEFSKKILTLNLDNVRKKNYFFYLVDNLENFPNYFGYDLENSLFNLFIQYIEKNRDEFPYKFASSLHDIFHRRTYYYLNHFYSHYYCQNFSNKKNIDKLLSHLKSYIDPQSHKPDEILTNLNDEQIEEFSLAPLYTNFIDSELFTALIYFEKYIQNQQLQANPNSLKIRDKLYLKISFLIDEFIDKNNLITRSRKLKISLQDESNLIWALRIALSYLINEPEKEFYICSKIKDIEEYQKVVLSIVSKDNTDRYFPKQKDLNRDITPELFSLKRTNLYISYNLSLMINQCEQFQDSFIDSAKEINKYIINDFIINEPLDKNIYFLSIKYSCLDIYLKSINSIKSNSITEIFNKGKNVLDMNNFSPGTKEDILYETSKLLLKFNSSKLTKLSDKHNIEHILCEVSKSYKPIEILFNIFKVVKTDFKKQLDYRNEEHIKQVKIRLQEELDFDKIHKLYKFLQEAEDPETNRQIENLFKKYLP